MVYAVKEIECRIFQVVERMAQRYSTYYMRKAYCILLGTYRHIAPGTKLQLQTLNWIYDWQICFWCGLGICGCTYLDIFFLIFVLALCFGNLLIPLSHRINAHFVNMEYKKSKYKHRRGTRYFIFVAHHRTKWFTI